jgi:energy-coupling factor transport system ATP-binding protein
LFSLTEIFSEKITPKALFCGNHFLYTSANRHGAASSAGPATAEDIVSACGGKAQPPLADIDLDTGSEFFDAAGPAPAGKPENAARLPLWRRILAALSGAAALGTFIYTLKEVDLTQILTTGFAQSSGSYMTVYLILLLSLVVFALCVSRKTEKLSENKNEEKTGRRLSKRTLAAMAMILIAVPLTIFAGIYFLGDRKYYFISLLVILETMLPFILVFEGRKPQARELVILAVLCAIGVAGRAAFHRASGLQTGDRGGHYRRRRVQRRNGFSGGKPDNARKQYAFRPGALDALADVRHGHIGFLAGILFKKELLRRDRLSLSIFGALTALVVYGGHHEPGNRNYDSVQPHAADVLDSLRRRFPQSISSTRRPRRSSCG